MPASSGMAIPGLRRPESVLVVVYTADGEVLLLKRSRPFEFWQSVTGSLASGESPAEAAARELAEETGLSEPVVDCATSRRFVIDPRWRNRFAPGVTENLEYEWHCCLPARREIVIDPTEHSEYRWCAIDDAIDEVWSWTNRAALQSVRSLL